MRPLYAATIAIGLWGLSWAVASVWTRRTQARPAIASQLGYLVPTLIGGGLFALGAQTPFRGTAIRLAEPVFWRAPAVEGWALFALTLVGLAFTWWARLTLGDLWSGTVQRKDDHRIVEKGPYGLVRHPIYTGLILALGAFAAQLATPGAVFGLVFIIFGFWIKARLEERFLSAQLGEAAYADYRRRTPMLVPFLRATP